ncbi:siderophore-iron reductase FhuF [Ancylobacter sp. IITR112]|uniref:siderophore-iron reductase FhuF n=1 Tax=Ancylobacter sp. IITR112 TaxID=3138073 RepID=UPI00352BCAFD
MNPRPADATRPLEVLPPEVAGAYGYVNSCLWLPPGPGGAVPGVSLRQGEPLVRLVDAFGASFCGCDHRAVVSMWFQIYVAALLPPLFAANTYGGPGLRAELDTAGVLIAADGTCTGFVLEGAAPARGDPFERFGPVFLDHLAPLIEALAAGTHVSRRLLWANVAESLQAIAAVAEHIPGAPPDAGADADLLLESPLWPDGRRNPLAGHTRYAPTDHAHRERSRRVCCLRHMLPGFETCPACPAPPDRTP